MKFRNILQIFCYYIIPIILSIHFIINPDRKFLNVIGWISIIIVCFILFIKPIAMITQYKHFKRFLLYRRELGILSFWLALYHSLGYLYFFKMYKLLISNNLASYSYFGIPAFLIMFILGITSNKISMKLLKTKWKKVQYLAYGALILTMFHIELVKYQTFHFSFIISALFVILKYLEYKKIRIKK